MAASNTRFTQNSLGQSKNPIDSDHGIYRDLISDIAKPTRLTVLHRQYLGVLRGAARATVVSVSHSDIGHRPTT
jgi:hypothetical protein